MKNIALQIFTWLVMSLTLAVVTVEAQSSRQSKAQIPFEFKIGNQTFGAGEYFINIKTRSHRSRFWRSEMFKIGIFG